MKKSAQRRGNYRTDPTFIFTLKSRNKHFDCWPFFEEKTREIWSIFSNPSPCCQGTPPGQWRRPRCCGAPRSPPAWPWCTMKLENIWDGKQWLWLASMSERGESDNYFKYFKYRMLLSDEWITCSDAAVLWHCWEDWPGSCPAKLSPHQPGSACRPSGASGRAATTRSWGRTSLRRIRLSEHQRPDSGLGTHCLCRGKRQKKHWKNI